MKKSWDFRHRPARNQMTSPKEKMELTISWWKCDMLGDQWIIRCKSPIVANATLLRLFLTMPKSPLLVLLDPEIKMADVKPEVLVPDIAVRKYGNTNMFVGRMLVVLYCPTSGWLSIKRWWPVIGSGYEVAYVLICTQDSNEMQWLCWCFRGQPTWLYSFEDCPILRLVIYQKWRPVTENAYEISYISVLYTW